MRKTKQIKRKEIIYELGEWERIEKSSQKLNMKTSDYIRRMSLNGQIVQVDVTGISTLFQAMRSISNNINQIARKANETHSIYESDVVQLKAEVSEICHILNLCLSELQSKKL